MTKVAEPCPGDRPRPFNPLSSYCLTRHRERFQGNPRMAQMYRTRDRMEEGVRAGVLAAAEGVLGRVERGEVVWFRLG